VNAQRGEGVFDGSIAALQLLNSLGYGIDSELPLHLVYNPVGAFLPGPQDELEADYKRQLFSHFGIVFNNSIRSPICRLGDSRHFCGTIINLRNTWNCW